MSTLCHILLNLGKTEAFGWFFKTRPTEAAKKRQIASTQFRHA
jgi:hypothetical protein